jgi:TRAP transporter 4TM/12TM fusion protein
MSRKLNLRGLPKEDLPTIKKAFKEGGILLIPILVIVGILAMGFSPSLAGFSAVVTVVIVVMLKKTTRLSFKKTLRALERGSVSVLGVANACACAGIVVSSIAMTGLGMRISSLVAYVGQSSIYIALIYTMIASLVLGMGMPTVAAYIVVATLGTSALVNLGIPELAAHIFVFFYAIICNVTPPVALAAYAAAPIAGEETNAFQIGLSAFVYAIAAFLIPFVFVFNQTLLMEGNVFLILFRTLICVIGMFALSLAIVGHYYEKLKFIERALAFVAAITLIHSDLLSNLVGFLLLIALMFRQREYISFWEKRKGLLKSSGSNK